MELLTKEIRARLPAWGNQDDRDPIAQVKFFTPDGGFTWYATEGWPDGDDFVFFGYVQGIEDEWGTWSLSELRGVRGAFGLPVERDVYFRPCPVSQVMR